MNLELCNGIRLTFESHEILFGAGVDGVFFPYSRTEADAGSLTLAARESYLRYEIRETDHPSLTASFRMEKEPHSVNVLLQGAVNPDGIFRQGFGTGGPSGYLETGAFQNNCPLKSHGLIALRFGGSYFCIYADDVTKYRTEFDISPGSTDGQKYYLSVSYITECVAKEDRLPSLHFIKGDNLEDILKQAAREIAAPFPPTLREPAYHWCSWYYYYSNFDFPQLAEFLDGLETISPPPLKYIQIDAGYFQSVGDWLDDFHLFPGGIKRAVELIQSRGYKPGIWIAPYMVGCRSKLFREHPDWVLKKRDGSYLVNAECFNEPKIWGYQDEEYYVLDTSHQEAMKYIRSVFRTFREWGVELFKTDFMFWGIADSRDILRATPGKTSVEYFRDFMSCIREEIGDAYWLGCIAPFLPMLGYPNAMRIGGDVGAGWSDGGFGPVNMIQELAADNYFNGVYWQNDSDAVMLRNYHIYLKDHEIQSLALLQAVSGGAVYTSETLHKLSADRLELFRFIQPPPEIKQANLPFLTKTEDLTVYHHEMDERHLIYLFNPTQRDIMAVYGLEELAGVKEGYVWKYKSVEQSAEMQSQIVQKIPSHGGVLILINTNRPIVEEPENLWLW